jgi:dCTP deaminase
MLADFEVREGIEKGLIDISPFDDKNLQPVSYDLTLSADIRVPRDDVHTIDPGLETLNDDAFYHGRVPSWRPYTTGRLIAPHGYILRQSDFILACTAETIKLDPTIAARVEGKSSLGRLGMAVHITAGFIDPGFQGQITLEIANLAPWDIVLYAGMPIAQIVFEQVSAPDRDYGQTGHYQGQKGPTESRYRFWS